MTVDSRTSSEVGGSIARRRPPSGAVFHRPPRFVRWDDVRGDRRRRHPPGRPFHRSDRQRQSGEDHRVRRDQTDIERGAADRQRRRREEADDEGEGDAEEAVSDIRNPGRRSSVGSVAGVSATASRAASSISCRAMVLPRIRERRRKDPKSSFRMLRWAGADGCLGMRRRNERTARWAGAAVRRRHQTLRRSPRTDRLGRAPWIDRAPAPPSRRVDPVRRRAPRGGRSANGRKRRRLVSCRNGVAAGRAPVGSASAWVATRRPTPVRHA